VVCSICGFHGKKLARHLREKHGISKDEYDGPILCEVARKNHEAVNYDNSRWIERARERGEDLTEHFEKMGQAVRESIMSNPEERKRRAKVMSDVNRSDVMRKKSSETAKKTSARKDIQEARAAQLKRWRDNNPDEFYDKCISKMLTCWNSKPEILLYDSVKGHSGYSLKRHRKIRSPLFNRYKQRDVDIGDSDKRVYIEFDGPLHFKQTSMKQLDGVREKDRLLDEHIIKHGWTLIRVSYDQFSYRKSDYGFKKECLERVFGILDKPTPGVHKIGVSYVE